MRTIGYTTGVFDMFHIGHLHLLRRAKKRCDHLIVGVTTDDLSFNLKGRYPVIPFEERMEIVKSVKYVDQTLPESNSDKVAAWNQLRFNIIFKGDDWKGTPQWNQLEDTFRGLGVEVVYFPYTKHTSSSQLRAALEALHRA